VSDKDIPSSGSRWEPADDVPTGTREHPTTPVAPAAVPADASAPARTRRAPRRSALAAAGVGLVLAGGLGGFAVGHAITDTEVSHPGTVPDGPPDGGRPNADRDGTVPGQSVPGGPGADDPGADDGGTA
jgi:hypothetical protein